MLPTSNHRPEDPPAASASISSAVHRRGCSLQSWWLLSLGCDHTIELLRITPASVRRPSELEDWRSEHSQANQASRSPAVCRLCAQAFGLRISSDRASTQFERITQREAVVFRVEGLQLGVAEFEISTAREKLTRWACVSPVMTSLGQLEFAVAGEQVICWPD